MVLSKLSFKSEVYARFELEELVKHVRSSNYHLPEDIKPTLSGFAGELYFYFIEGPRIMQEILRNSTDEVNLENLVIADFCCGNGSKTMKLAREFPNAEIYGFDVVPHMIRTAKRKIKSNKVNFAVEDVYNFEDDHNFNVVTFYAACGPLSDKIIQYATARKVPVIAGKFCCYAAISKTALKSGSMITNILAKISRKIESINRKKAPNYIRPSQGIDMDLLSAYARDALKMTEEELERTSALAIYSKIAIKIIDLNRILKLAERGYQVYFDNEKHIFAAIFK